MKSGWTPSIHQVNDNTYNLINNLHDQFNCKPQANCKHLLSPNITKNQIILIKQFFNKYPNLIIKPADKGGFICIMNRTAYEMEIHRQLSDIKYYHLISNSESQKDTHLLNHMCYDMFNQGLIDSKLLEFILPPAKSIPRQFYGLPKIHKEINQWTSSKVPFMPKIRPIVAAINSETWAVSQFIDLHLVPFATKHPSYIKDTQHFLDILSNTDVPENSILLTLDIESLYTNLSHDECIQVLHDIFDPLTDPVYPFIIKLLDYCLRHNDFEFNGQMYRQILGSQMGAPFSPQLSNLLVAKFEQTLFSMNIKLPIFWKRFLDDVFAIWTHSLEELKIFMSHLNSISPFIQFTLEHNPLSVDFLDVTVFKGPLFSLTHKLSTKLFTKKTASLTLLNPQSHHPGSTFKGIALSQYLRLNRISSSLLDFQASAFKLTRTLISQGYNKKLLKKQYLKAIHHRHLSINHIDHHRLTNCSKTCSICSLLFTLKPNYIKSIINWTRIPPLCEKVHCNISSAIYILACKHCPSIYIGQTTHLRNRILNHMSDIRHYKSPSMSGHFSLKNLPKITVLQSNLPPSKLLYWETFWIHNLSQIYNLLNLEIPRINQTLPMVFTFNPHSQQFSKIARNLIQNSSWVSNDKKPNLVSAFCRNTNLKECFVTSNYTKNPRKSITKHLCGTRKYRTSRSLSTYDH